MASDLCFLDSVAELRELYATRRLSPVEAVRAILDHVETADPPYQRPRDRHSRAGPCARPAPPKPRTPRAHAGAAGRHPIHPQGSHPDPGDTDDAGFGAVTGDWVPRLRRAGCREAVRGRGGAAGKDQTPRRWGWKGDTDNRVAGPTHNPLAPGPHRGRIERGAPQAAAAAGFGPLAQGSDGAGSIRIPACMCGVCTGSSPSWSLVPQYPGPAPSSCSPTWVRSPAASADARGHAHRHGRRGRPRPRLAPPAPPIFPLPSRGGGRLDGDPHRLVAGSRVRRGRPGRWWPWRRPRPGRFAELGCRIEEDHPDLGDPWEPVVDRLVVDLVRRAVSRDDFDAVKDRLDPGARRGHRGRDPATPAPRQGRRTPAASTTTTTGAASWSAAISS